MIVAVNSLKCWYSCLTCDEYLSIVQTTRGQQAAALAPRSAKV